MKQAQAETEGVHIRIVLVDDHTMMREGTRKLLEEDPALVVVGEAQDGSEAVEVCNQVKPDVVVLDIAMRSMNGFETARRLMARPSEVPAILVLTAYDQGAYVQAMLKMGIRGYWLKSARGSALRQAVHDVYRRRQSLDPEVQRLLVQEQEAMPVQMDPLTSRESEVLKFIVQGKRNAEIGQRLGVTIKTIEAHLTSLYSKLGVQSRAEAIAFAQRQGLLLE
jgi:DNA-binding NarL/FixJ family response regulator